ncbi:MULTISPECIES: DUF6157 family protein [Paenibacillus]|uniref:DUF6157 family protein n=1 Tax=Paenibacillus TaxID=44249 RepID=UPI002FE2F571
MSYQNTFILISSDCPVQEGIEPISRKESKPVHVIQYELLTANPYKYNYDELLFETHVRHKGISDSMLLERRQEFREALFAKKHACMRASALPKRYGWGVHYDAEGKMAIYGADSPQYRAFAETGREDIQLLLAMRSRRT